MPISLRLSLLFVLATILGFSLIIYAHFVNNWNAIGYFAKGFITATIGLVGTSLFSGITMFKKGPWRQFALIEAAVSLILVVCLVILWAWS